MKELRIGLFLGLRQIQRASLWSTMLVIMIVVLTFLNLISLTGILSGIVDGATNEVKDQALSDVILTPLEDKTRIQETQRLEEELINFHEIKSFSTRYTGLAVIEANYKERRDLTLDPDVIAVNITGIDVEAEKRTTSIEELVVEGDFIDSNESGYILLGKYNVDRYAKEFGDVFDSLKNIRPGDEVMVRVGAEEREFTVKGIIDSKVDQVSIGVYMTELDFRRIFERVDQNANQIIIKLNNGYSPEVVRDRLRSTELSELAEISSFKDEEPKFVVDVRNMFDLLGLILGFVGITVASITIFIVIFISAISRRQQIGILKAIGITRRTIEYAYITQAFIYAFVGSCIGILITQYLIIPYFLANPIDFPFSDVSMSISLIEMFYRGVILTLVACVAGFFPVWMIARQNTLDSVLGRK